MSELSIPKPSTQLLHPVVPENTSISLSEPKEFIQETDVETDPPKRIFPDTARSQEEGRPPTKYQKQSNSSSIHSTSNGSNRIYSYKKQSIAQLAAQSFYLSLKEFLDTQDPGLDEFVANSMYKKYKVEYFKLHLLEFFDKHKKDNWFLERYDSDAKIKAEERRAVRVKARYEAWTAHMQTAEMKETEICFDEPSEEKMSEEQSNSNEQKNVDEEGDGPDEDGALQEDSVIDLPPTLKRLLIIPSKSLLIIKSVPPSIPRSAVLDIAENLSGFKDLHFSDPMPSKKFHRVAWIEFESGADMAIALDTFERSQVDNFQFHCAIQRSDMIKIRTAPEITLTTERIKKDYQLATSLAIQLNKECGLTENSFVVGTAIPIDSPIEQIKLKLDQLIYYLRRVHLFCYYCGIQCDDAEGLSRSCGHLHLRKCNGVSVAKSESYLLKWVAELEESILRRLKQIPANDIEPRNLDKALQELILKIEEEKWKCAECGKLFRGAEFVEKHLRLKHEAKIKLIERDISLFNNFVACPGDFVMSFLSKPRPAPAPIPMKSSGSTNSGIHPSRSSGLTLASPPLRTDYSSGRDSHHKGLQSSQQQQHRAHRSYVDLDAPNANTEDAIEY